MKIVFPLKMGPIEWPPLKYVLRETLQKKTGRLTWNLTRHSNWKGKSVSKPSFSGSMLTSWWLNQPIWKICSSNWIISPSRGENEKYLKPPVSYVKLSFCVTISKNNWGRSTRFDFTSSPSPMAEIFRKQFLWVGSRFFGAPKTEIVVGRIVGVDKKRPSCGKSVVVLMNFWGE